ncbi:glycosyltransferase [Candidatus Woesearchaeota archaeon]|nr:glycosyltransferase [Candidatus Woesearchaeota archaeon]
MISLFIPCYNEEKMIEENIKKIYETLRKLKKPFELIIVNDGSTDKTEFIAKRFAPKQKEIKYMFYENGPSRRENLAEAMKKAKGEIIVFMDLDLSVDLVYLPKLIESIEAGNDVAIGSRYKGVQARRTLGRKIISTIYNFIMQTYLKSKIHDHQCGFKAFKKEKLLPLLEEIGYDSKFERGWFWDVELLVRAQKKGYKIDEFSVQWHAGKQSSFDLKRELKMLPYVLKLKWRI